VARLRQRFWGTVVAFCAAVLVLSLVCVIPEMLPRPFLGFGEGKRPPVSFRVDGERVGVSWYRAGGRRAPWAGQINRWGVRYNVYTYDGSDVSVPTWWVGVVAAIGLVAGVAVRRRGVKKRGHCAACGYNLVGNVSGVCPECGTAVAAGSA
jgi:hypothetical protein